MERAKCEKDILRNRTKIDAFGVGVGSSDGFENIIENLINSNSNIINGISNSTCGLLVSEDESNII